MIFDRCIVSGGRRFTNYDRILADLRALRGDRTVFRVAHGGNGIRRQRPWEVSADALAQRAAEEMGLHGSAWAYEVDERVDGSGRAAPCRRDTRMLVAEVALAVEADAPLLTSCYPDPMSTGTWHTAREALRLGLPVVVWTGALTDPYDVVNEMKRAVRHSGVVKGDRFVCASTGSAWTVSQLDEILRIFPVAEAA